MNELFKLYYLFFYISKFLATEKLTNGAIIPTLKVLYNHKNVWQKKTICTFYGVYYTVYATGGNFEAHKILQVN